MPQYNARDVPAVKMLAWQAMLTDRPHITCEEYFLCVHIYRVPFKVISMFEISVAITTKERVGFFLEPHNSLLQIVPF